MLGRSLKSLPFILLGLDIVAIILLLAGAISQDTANIVFIPSVIIGVCMIVGRFFKR
ncbi:MAG TPA: hypothetical protein VF837_04795 [Patescibacteria group bacterium]